SRRRLQLFGVARPKRIIETIDPELQSQGHRVIERKELGGLCSPPVPRGLVLRLLLELFDALVGPEPIVLREGRVALGVILLLGGGVVTGDEAASERGG